MAFIPNNTTPDNLSEQQFQAASWYVEHKLQLKAALTVFLVVWCAAFGGYAIWGMVKLFLIEYPGYRQMQRDAGVNYVNFAALENARPIDVRTVQVFAAGAGKADAVATVRNPNARFAATFRYQFVGEGATPSELEGFLLPGEEKPLLSLGIPTQTSFRSARLEIRDVQWARLDAHEIPDWAAYRTARMALSGEEVVFTPAQTQGQVSRVTFTVKNASAYSYWNVRFIVLLYRGQSIAAVNAIDLSSLRTGESRPASVTWFENVPSVTKTEIRPEVNILDQSAFIAPAG
ncbi:hypothetical protein EPO33_05470 [Patescibacteria group bacterium]|nr:MAG: hypothetical protein EPO33_05470 [Patescibacteria group bacterium]